MTQTAGTGMPLRDYRIHRYVNAFCPKCHEEDPDRPLADVARLSGWLAVRDERVWLERGCPDHGLISTLYDESAEILSYLEQWTAPTKVHGPDTLGNFKPVPVRLRRRSAADADAAHLHPARGPHRPLQSAMPHVLRRVEPGGERDRSARGGARVGRRPSRPRERSHRRAHADRRRADAVSVARAAARSPRRAADRAHPDQLERPAHRAGRRVRRDAQAASRAG